nr:YegP family protein [Limosilactobacillus mucosae]
MWFSIRKSSNNQYYFVIKSENNEVVATSELYYTKYSCKKTIDAIKARVNRNSIVVDTTE